MATFFDDASLVMIPSGIKESKLYSIKPTDGSGDFTFSRGTDTATRVNASGLIEKERSNQLLQSNTFDNASWTQSDITTLTSGQSGYDGTSDAWLVEKSASANGYLRQNISLSGVHTFSLYAKSNTLNGVLIQTRGASTKSAQFNLSTGAIGTTANNIDAQIENVGGGWYRCSVSVNDSAITQVRIFVCDDGTTIGTTSGTIYIQDAQLESGLVATDYIETTTAAVYEGITDNLPRLDYSGGASCPSLLLEPSRTNGNLHSEYFSGSGFGIVAATATPNATTSPEGVSNATSFIGSASTAEHIIYTTGASTYNGDTTISIFAKANGYDYFVLGAGAQSANKPVLFNIANGTKVGNFTGWSSYSAPIDSDIEDYGNGWYRLSVTFAATSGVNTNMFFGSMPTDSVASGANSSTQNGTDGSYIYGASIEAGSYETSYIPTYGTSASRVADSCSKTGISDLIGQTEGTIYFETTYYPETNNGQGERWVYLQGNTSSDYIRLWQDVTGGSKRIRALVSAGGVQQVNISSLATELGLSDTEPRQMKFAFVYAENDFRMYVNGNVLTDTSGTPPSLTEINFNNTFKTLFPLKQALVFKTALTDAECIALTTI